jgi:threonine synthase
VARLVEAGRVEVVTLSEDELRTAWQLLSHEEGVFCEPASAAGVAALERLPDVEGTTAVCIVTGHGLKDAGAVDDGEAETIEATLAAVLEAIG